MGDSPATASHATIECDMPCGRCGYNLRGLPRDGACPECGLSIPKLFEPLPEEDAAWLTRVTTGIALFCCPVVFGSKLFLARLWDYALALLVVAVLAAVSIWLITTSRPGASAEDPLGWKQRAARAAAIGLPILFALQILTRHWYWAGMPPAVSRAATAAVPLLLAIGMLVSLDYLSSFAMRFSLHEIVGALRKVAWIFSISFLFTQLWDMFASEQGPRMVALQYLGSAAFVAYPVTGVATLLLLGRLLERLKEIIERRSPADRRTPETLVHDPRPATPLGWGIVLLSFLVAAILGTGRLMSYFGLIALGLWLAGGWIISRNLRPTLHEQARGWMSSLFYACALLAAASQLFLLALPLWFGQPIWWEETTAKINLVSSAFYLVADVGCIWLVLGMLQYKAHHIGAAVLRQKLRRSRWAITAVLIVQYSGLPGIIEFVIADRFLGRFPPFMVSASFRFVLLLLLTYAVILWGRLWHLIEAPPMEVDAAPAAAPEPAPA